MAGLSTDWFVLSTTMAVDKPWVHSVSPLCRTAFDNLKNIAVVACLNLVSDQWGLFDNCLPPCLECLTGLCFVCA